MSASPLNLPVDIPWKVIAATTDMEATRFGLGGLPPQWRSSLAIAVYEPSIDDLPTELCGDRISYLKVTCSITGWQATQADADRLGQAYPQLDTDALVREYFACYGVLLSVSVFAHTNDENAGEAVPVRIIDMQPKTRDLYQMATEAGEILSGSSSDVTTDKSYSATHDSQWGLSAQASGGLSPAQGGTTGGGGFGFNVLGGLTHSWGESDKDSSSTQIDASRDRRERQSTTTNISQMYNLLTGYHTGTNRAVFLLLPRPHILQPTDHRTFIQGLRIIEGIQEFLLIVSRPRDAHVTGLCVEAHLDTSHLPEELQVDETPDEYEEDYEDFCVQKYVDNSKGPNDNIKVDQTQNVLRDGFVVDTRIPIIERNQRRSPRADGLFADDGHSGMHLLESNSSDHPAGRNALPQSTIDFAEWFYGAVSSGSVQVTGLLRNGDSDGTLKEEYRILTRAANPKPKISQVTAPYIMTSRCLAACFTSGVNDCVTPVAVPNDFCIPSEWVANEIEITVSSDTNAQSRLPSMKEFLTKSQRALATSWRGPGRYAPHEVGFLDTDYVKTQLLSMLSDEQRIERVQNIRAMPDALRQAITNAYQANCTVAMALQPSLTEFARKTGLTVYDALRARHYLLGLAIDAVPPEPQPVPE